MFKTKCGNAYQTVSHPDHMEVAGYLAAHWGNSEFSSMGIPDPVSSDFEARSECVFAVSHHDNGWWEWEALPRLDPSDYLPIDLSEVVKDLSDSMGRWRIGVQRFADERPYASALIAHHALNLYKPRLDPRPVEHDIHPLYWKALPPVAGIDRIPVQEFIYEMQGQRDRLLARVALDPATAAWTQASVFQHNGRLMQVLDAISIFLSSNLIPPLNGDRPGDGRKYDWNLLNVPRKGMFDQTVIKVRLKGPASISLDPFPFSLDPLTVRVPARFTAAFNSQSEFFSRWNQLEKTCLEFTFSSM